MTSEANGVIPNAEVAALKLSDSPQPNGSSDATNNESDPPPSFEECFKSFSKFGDTKSDGKLITLSQSDKWMKQAKVIDGKKITTTDTGIYFKKLKSLKVGVVDYQKFLQDLAASKKLEVEEVKKKLSTCGPPGFTSVRSVKSAGAAVDRLTDTSKYTGSHKQRFDQSGKGRGIAGRKDEVDTSGYVSGYKDKDKFGKK